MSFDVSIVPCGSYDMVETRAALSAALFSEFMCSSINILLFCPRRTHPARTM